MKVVEELNGAPPRDTSFWLDIQSQAQSQIERIQTLLSRLADGSHAKMLGRSDECTLSGVLDEMLNVFAAQLMEKQIHVDIELDPNLPPLVVHGGRFRQMWRLLFMEEITHLKEGDSLQISATTEADGNRAPSGNQTCTGRCCGRR
jgi:signal transduction histidine kinase